jgi:hypothetical protein
MNPSKERRLDIASEAVGFPELTFGAPSSRIRRKESFVPRTKTKKKPASKTFLRRHSLGLVALAVVVALIVAYIRSDPDSHLGSFFGNAIADWTGVLVTVLMTKHLYEKGSAESKQPRGKMRSPALEFLREHSLTVFLLVTWLGWVVVFRRMDTNSRWGLVVGNLVSQWTQILGLVWMTKLLMEAGSKEAAR